MLEHLVHRKESQGIRLGVANDTSTGSNYLTFLWSTLFILVYHSIDCYHARIGDRAIVRRQTNYEYNSSI